MVVVDAGLAGVEVGWGDPFDVAVGVDGGGPAAVFVDEAVVGSAGQCQLVDVGVAVVGPVAQRVVDLAAVGGYGAAGFGAAAVAGDEHDPLGGGGDASGAEQVQCLSGGLVEDGQPVVGVAGQADDVFDGIMVPPPVTPTPARDSRSCRVVRMMIEVGNPLCWPNSPDCRALRPIATSASCWRCARVR